MYIFYKIYLYSHYFSGTFLISGKIQPDITIQAIRPSHNVLDICPILNQTTKFTKVGSMFTIKKYRLTYFKILVSSFISIGTWRQSVSSQHQIPQCVRIVFYCSDFHATRFYFRHQSHIWCYSNSEQQASEWTLQSACICFYRCFVQCSNQMILYYRLLFDLLTLTSLVRLTPSTHWLKLRALSNTLKHGISYRRVHVLFF